MCEKGLFAAIKYFGSQRALAKEMGVTQQTISHWLNHERKMSDITALQLFVKTQGAVTLQELFSSPQLIYKILEKASFFLKYPAVAVPIKAIHLKDFICPKYTDADNHHLLEAKDPFISSPILIDTHHQLIACECRLRANSLLGRSTALVHRINLRDVILGNFSLTTLLQTLPISEKAAVGLAIEREMGNRQGKRMDLSLVDTYPQVAPGIKTRTIAAILAGFDSDFLYRKVKGVVQHGLSNVIQAMDNQVCSIAQAEKIALLPKQQQCAALMDLLNQKNIHQLHFKVKGDVSWQKSVR